MASEIQAPWTPEQTDVINRYQTAAEFPLICSRTRDRHGGLRVVLIARRDGMRCSDPACDYRQNWVLDYMATPRNVSGFDVAGCFAARAGVARSLREVEAEAAELGLGSLAGLAGRQAGQFDGWTPFTAMLAPAFRLPFVSPEVSAACYEASFGWVHVKPSCRCSKEMK